MRSLITISFLLIGVLSYGQQSINSAGGTITNGTHQIDFSLGIVSGQVLKNDSASIEPGVVQPGKTSGTGIISISQSSFSIYPNPTSGLVVINGKDNMVVTILNNLGQSVGIFNSDSPIDLSNLANGIYTLIVDKQSFKILKTN